MTWLVALLLAGLALAIAVLAFRVPRDLWAMLALPLVLGLAGFALQAEPDLPAAPRGADAGAAPAFDISEIRRSFVAEEDYSQAPFLTTSDAMARRGRYATAAQLLRRVAQENPDDHEVWLAQALALLEHADGTLTAASVYAFNRAAAARPDSIAPGYFIGASQLRQGRLAEARETWATTLAEGGAEADGRPILELQLAQLTARLQQAAPFARPPALPAEGN